MKKVKLTLASFLANFAFISSLMSLSPSVDPETFFMALVFAAAAMVSWRGYLFWAWERDGAGRFGGIFASRFSRLESGGQTALFSLPPPADPPFGYFQSQSQPNAARPFRRLLVGPCCRRCSSHRCTHLFAAVRGKCLARTFRLIIRTSFTYRSRKHRRRIGQVERAKATGTPRSRSHAPFRLLQLLYSDYYIFYSHLIPLGQPIEDA